MKEEKSTIENSIPSLVEDYFLEIKKVSQFHLNFFSINDIPTIDINMLCLKDIIFRSLSFLQNIDDAFFSKLLRKMYFDTKDLSDFLGNFEKNTQFLDNLFENNFLNKISEYKDTKDQIKIIKSRGDANRTIMIATDNELKYFKPKTKSEINDYNKLRGRNVDAVHRYMKSREDMKKLNIKLKNLENSLKEEFKSEFSKSQDLYLTDLITIINSKLFYFNKLMWQEANKNEHIKEYFSNLGLKEFNLNSYAKNYLKNINLLKSQNINKLEQIEEALRNLK
jgi:hypothetical protein